MQLSQAIKPNDATKKSNENLNYNDFELQVKTAHM